MKKFFVAAMIVLAPCFTGFAHAYDPVGVGFFRAVEDLPLMPGMTEMSEESVVFDQPEGRVVQVAGRGPAGAMAPQITAFYAETLPHLGWQQENATTYVREQERLTIEFAPVMGGPLPVRFTIKPR